MKPVIQTGGYAVKQGSNIAIRSVGPSQVIAMLNWLFYYRGVVPSPNATDMQITTWFDNHADHHETTSGEKVCVIEVTVQENS